MKISTVASLVALVVLGFAGCASTAPQTQSPPYQPSYRFSTSSPSSNKFDVTIGLVEPAFVGDGEAFAKENRAAQPFRSWVKSITTSFNELLVAKGMAVVGPFTDVEGLTFPEKRSMSFAIYPVIDFTAGFRVENVRPEKAGIFGGVIVVCDAVLEPVGQIQLVAEEPLSRQKLWIKRLDISEQAQRFRMEGNESCANKKVTREVYDAWMRIYESVYTSMMRTLDRHVTSEEFVALKREADLLKERKSY